MPQTIEGKQLNTLTLAADDLVKVTYGGGGSGRILTVLNYGPGKVMISNSESIVPSFTSTDCLLLMSSAKHVVGPVSGPVTFSLIADTADTVVTFSFL